ncbi:MAG: hypothetical protein AAF387_03510 [Pseudomonadota bacterium]
MRCLSFLLTIFAIVACASSAHAAMETFARTTIEWKLLPNGPSSQTVRSDLQTNGSPAFSEQVETYGTARTEAKFGYLKIYGESIREPVFDSIGGRAARGLAWYVDEFTINGGVGIGTASIGVIVTGVRQSTADLGFGSNAGGYNIEVSLDPDGVNTPVIDSSNPKSSREFQGTGLSVMDIADGTSGEFQFTYGVPFELKVLLSAYAAVDPVGLDGIPSNELQSHSILNLGNTATTYIELPQGASIAAASGTQYLLGPLPIPIPPALLMFLPASLFALLPVSRRKIPPPAT